MKRMITAIATLAIILGVQAQDYNKWSVDVRAGVNKPATSSVMTPGYKTTTPSPWNAGIGVRYMFNTKFGLRLGVDYNSFTNADESKEFSSEDWNFNLQGIANLGRIMNFEEWTSRLGLLAHAGFGYGRLTSDDFSGTDQTASLHAGFTPQFKLSEKVSLFMDFAAQANSYQHQKIDGNSAYDPSNFHVVNYTAAIGININLGKKEKHADWTYDLDEENELELKVASLEKEVETLKGQVKGNETVGTTNKSSLESFKSNVDNVYAKKTDLGKGVTTSSVDFVKELVDKGYINVYFGFNSTKPKNYSISAIDFMIEYLRANAGASVDVLGYADEIGGDSYNQRLSSKRANAVKQLLMDAGISGSRIIAKGNGEDRSVNKNSEGARQIARRVTFRVR